MKIQLGLDFDIDLLRYYDPMKEALRLGSEAYNYLGAMSLPEMQLSYALASQKRHTYDNSHNLRMRRHILLYWKRGWYKTSIVNLFLKQCTPAVNIFTNDKIPTDKPTYLQISGDFSRERLRGSIQNKELVYPLICKPDFLIAGELLAFIGSTKEQQAIMINYMNKVLEEGQGEVGLVKMGSVKITEELRNEMNQRGILFDEKEKVMNYDVKNTFWGATRELEKNELRVFDQSGYLDRHVVLRWQPSDDQFKNQWRYIPKEPDCDELRRFNYALWNTKFDYIPKPPYQYFNKANKAMDDIYNEIEEEHHISASDLRSGRDKTSVYQIITAFAIMDSFNQESLFLRYSRLRYTDEHLNKSIDFLKTYLKTKVQFLIESGKYDDTTDENEAIKHLKKKFNKEVLRTTLINYIESETGRKKAWCYKYIRKLIANNQAEAIPISDNPKDGHIIRWL